MIKMLCCVLLALYSVDSNAYDYPTKKEIQEACEKYAEVWITVYEGIDYWYYGGDKKIPLDEDASLR